jgi:hypothetical protein
MQKLYWVDCEPLFPAVSFTNESDRNEMALALWQEYVYFLTMRILNWYEDPIMSGIKEDASNNVYTWESEVL